jgi:hypothetical protein
MTTYPFTFGPHPVDSELNEDPNLSIDTARRIFAAIQVVAQAKGKVGRIAIAADGTVTISPPVPVPLRGFRW